MAFVKGQSGNESGRPKGATAATKIRQDIDKAMPGILATVVKAAENGDIQAAKILIDKLCPNLKPVALPIDLPLPINGGLSEMGGEIIKATMNGQIPPDIGSMLITALTSQYRLMELDVLVNRIVALENENRAFEKILGRI
jgi:Family of unknown function (DUF5681)